MQRIHLTWVAAGVLAWMALTPAASAADAPVSYTCAIQGSPGLETVGVSLALADVPTEVRAGDAVALRGRLTLHLSSKVALASRLALSRTVRLGPTILGLTARTAGQDTSLALTLTPPAPAAIATPFDLGADVAAARWTVPSDAKAQVTVSLPAGEFVDSTLESAPPKVAFTSTIEQASLLQATRTIECWLPEGARAASVARIDVAPTPTDEPTDEPTEPPAQSTPDLPPVEIPPLDDLPVPSEGATPPVSDPVLPATDASEAPALVNAPIPPATVRSGTFIPAWALLLFAAVLPATAIGIALSQRRRLVAAKALAAKAKEPLSAS